MIRTLLVDDQTLVRQGIRSLLELSQTVTVVGEAADGEEALACIHELKPDVMLLDLRMPKLDGLGVLRALSGTSQVPPTLILTTFDDDELVLEGLRLGAKGYLLKDVSLRQLLDAVETLAQGKTLVQPAVTERLLRGLQRTTYPSLNAPDALTPRELEVVRLMAGGYSNKEIGGALGVSEGTVKNHVSSVLSKLGVRDRTRAVLRALELIPNINTLVIMAAHEMTHVLHRRVSDVPFEGVTVAEKLMLEGLATLVSKVIVPGLKDETYLWLRYKTTTEGQDVTA